MDVLNATSSMLGCCVLLFTVIPMQATMLEELSALNPLTKLRRLHLHGRADDPRLNWLNLGHDVLVMTWSSECVGPHLLRTTAAFFISILCLRPAPELDLWVAGAHSPGGRAHHCTRSMAVPCARPRRSCCLVQVTFKAAYKKLEGQPRLQGIRQLAALSAEGWVPPISCRCCRSACY